MEHLDEKQRASSYSTASLELAAFLLANGLKLQAYSQLPNGQTVFDFDDSAESLVASYFSGAEVPAVRFWSELKRLKSIIHNQTKHNHENSKSPILLR